MKTMGLSVGLLLVCIWWSMTRLVFRSLTRAAWNSQTRGASWGGVWVPFKVYSCIGYEFISCFAWILDRQVWCDLFVYNLSHTLTSFSTDHQPPFKAPEYYTRRVARPSVKHMLVPHAGHRTPRLAGVLSAAPRTFSIVLIRRSIIHSVQCVHGSMTRFLQPSLWGKWRWFLREQRRIIHA